MRRQQVLDVIKPDMNASILLEIMSMVEVVLAIGILSRTMDWPEIATWCLIDIAPSVSRGSRIQLRIVGTLIARGPSKG